MNPIDLLILLEKRIKITATTTPINLLPTKWTLAEIDRLASLKFWTQWNNILAATNPETNHDLLVQPNETLFYVSS